MLCLPEIFQQNHDNAFHLLSLPDGNFSASEQKRECLEFFSEWVNSLRWCDPVNSGSLWCQAPLECHPEVLSL